MYRLSVQMSASRKRKRVPLLASSTMKVLKPTSAVAASSVRAALAIANKQQPIAPGADGRPNSRGRGMSSGGQLIARFHTLQKQKSQLLAASAPAAEIKAVDLAIEAIGGLDTYQKLSQAGEKMGGSGGASGLQFTSAKFVADTLLRIERSELPPLTSVAAGTTTATADSAKTDHSDDADSDGSASDSEPAAAAAETSAQPQKKGKLTLSAAEIATRTAAPNLRYRLLDVGSNANPFICSHVKAAYAKLSTAQQQQPQQPKTGGAVTASDKLRSAVPPPPLACR